MEACGDPCDALCQDSYRSNLIVGYRFARLDDNLGIMEQLTSTDPNTPPPDPGAPEGVVGFVVRDSFSAKNQFHGADVGVMFEYRKNRWSLDFLPKIAVGNTRQTVDIDGSTRITDRDGSRVRLPGGLLTQEGTNIGHYSTDKFSVIPEIDTNIGYQISPHVRFTFGYTFLYWSQVARAGSQIDRNVNSTLLPGSEEVITGDTTRPRFRFQETGFWAQGLNFGLDFRW